MSNLITLLRTPAVVPKNGLNASSIVPSLALGYLSSSLKDQNFQVQIIDAQIEGIGQLNPIEKQENYLTHGLSETQIIAKISPEAKILGISIMFSSEWPYVRELIKKIKEAHPHLFIIAGGEHITAETEFSLRECPQIDMVIYGEGEETLIEFLKHKDQKETWNSVNGIAYFDQGTFIKTPGRKRIKNVDEIPWPYWEENLLELFFQSKLSHGPYKGKTMPILASRGCPYDCQFCSNRTMWGNYYWSRSPKDVVDEIEFYINKYQIECFEFMDLTVYMKKSWIKDFCHELIDRNLSISWQCTGGTRTEALDEELILLTKKAGCTYLGFAPESGSLEVLKAIKKKIKLQRMIGLYKLMKKHKVGTRANLIIGFPGETRLDIFKTIFLQLKLAFYGVLDAPLFIFTPYPGTGLYRSLYATNQIPNFNQTPQNQRDSFFFDLGQEFGSVSGKSYNPDIGIKELRLYQTLGMGLFYTLQYLFYPKRLLSLVKNSISGDKSNSVFEQRIAQNFKFLRQKK